MKSPDVAKLLNLMRRMKASLFGLQLSDDFGKAVERLLIQYPLRNSAQPLNLPVCL
jgi:hypothetical protein